jgi:hypothetical protein
MYVKMTLKGPGQVKSKEACFCLHTYTILYSVHTRTHNKDQRNKEAGVYSTVALYFFGKIYFRSSYKIDASTMRLIFFMILLFCVKSKEINTRSVFLFFKLSFECWLMKRL